MYFDKSNATLLASADDLDQLTEYLATSADTRDSLAIDIAEWEEANIADAGMIYPTVAGIVEIMHRPARSIAIERFDGELVDISFVAWDRKGRAVTTQGVGGDSLAMTATHFELLPALLSQTVRLNPKSTQDNRAPLLTTAKAVDQALKAKPATQAKDSGGSLDDETVSAPLDILGSFVHSWRATGSWQARTADISLTVIDAGAKGLWRIERDSVEPGTQPTPEMEVRLIPCTGHQVTSKLGDVVTGRKSVEATTR